MLFRIFNRSYRIKAITITAIMLLLTACGGGGGGSSDSTNVAPSSLTFGGSVGDGPIVGATITVQDSNGNIISTQTSDNFANYRITLSSMPSFPLTITANGGTDLVTGTVPSFSMKSIVQNSNQGTANINPFSTLIVSTAQSMPGGLVMANLDTAKAAVRANLGFGLDTQAIPDVISTNIGVQNVANMAKASEALAEMIRRIRQTLLVAGIDQSEDTIISRISGDLTDGLMDGGGISSDTRITASAHVVSAQILLESMINKLKVGGVNATIGLDNAIAITQPSASMRTGDVAINAAMIEQAKAAIAAAQTITPGSALDSIANTLDGLVAGSMPGAIENQLPASSSDNLDQALLDIATAPESMLVSVNTVAKNATPPPPPPTSGGSLTITGTAPAAYTWGTIAQGSTIYVDRSFTFGTIPTNYVGMKHLRTANNDKTKSGNPFVSFNVNQPVTVYVGLDTFVNPIPGWLSSWTNTGDQITAQTTFRIFRKNFTAGTISLGGNEGNGSSSMYIVMVGDANGSVPTPPPAQAPTLTFSTDAASVAYNDSATLSWTSSNANSCSASGAWSGTKGTSGMTSVGPLTADMSYTLTCSGDGGQVTRSVSISVGAPPAQTPTVALSANPSSITTNASTSLSWSSSNVDSCSASGGWSGGKALSGSISSGALTSDTTFTLTCSGTGGTASQSVTVTVSAPPPPPAPSVTLSASPTLVGYNSTTSLSWSVSNADSCTASGGWSGSKNKAGGSETSVPLTLDTSFTLSCSGPGGSTSKSVSVAVQPVTGSATLSWTPPTTNADGTVLSDLAGYKIHYGTASGSYTDTVVVSNPGISSYVIDNLPAGTHYFVVTAFDTSGNESVYSNEASKSIN